MGEKGAPSERSERFKLGIIKNVPVANQLMSVAEQEHFC